MKRHCAFNLLRGVLLAIACAGPVGVNPGFASVQDSRFNVSADRASVDFDVRDTSRREVLSRLFADTGIDIKWINAWYAEETMNGKFTGTPAAVARQLLAQMDFIIVHDGSGDGARITRVVIVGPGKGEKSSARLAAIEEAMAPAKNPKSGEKSESAAAISAGESPPQAPAAPSSRATGPVPDIRPLGDASGLIRPLPSDASATLLVPLPDASPALIPPPAGEMASPFTPAGTGSAAPSVPAAK